ncbi:hypothetical protein IAQ61_001216 [Plenodomus lingam]|uniref:uncharacterized protein n=1 Tax=Leptosphaeria maculans TaxID=5022 RepID=UPI0033220B9A|nr:hypothetical protein IAQ61_001216 [Plenodomus lingam]
MSSQTISIPRSTAMRAHCGSWLFTLPSELRNKVYELIIPVGKVITLHREEESQRMSCRITGDCGPATTALTQLPASDGAHPKLHDCLALLLTCQQTYHEGAGTLYGANILRFSQNTRNPTSVCKLLSITVNFCSSIGFAIHFLQRIEIDLSCISVPACICKMHRRGVARCTHKCIDLAPLQKLLWQEAVENCEISFVKSKFQGLVLLQGQGRYDYNVDVLNNLVSCLRRDTAGLRRYVQQLQTLEICPSSMLSTNHCLMKVVPSTQPYRGLAQLRYRHGSRHLDIPILLLDSDGNHLHQMAPYKANFMGLPNTLRSKIFREILCPDANVIFDLETGRRPAINRTLLDMWWPGNAVDDLSLLFWRENVITFRMTSTSRDLPSSRFQPMKEVLCVKRTFDGWLYPWFPRANFKACSNLKLELAFKLEDGVTLADVEVGVKGLLRLASGYQGREFRITCSLYHESAPDTVIEVSTFSLQDVQANVLELLSAIDDEDEENANFEIYINGHGESKRLEMSMSSGKRILPRSLLSPSKGFETIVAQHGSVSDLNDDITNDSEARYHATLWSWLAFVREVVTIKPTYHQDDLFEEQQRILLCHTKYFGIEVTKDHERRKVDVFYQIRHNEAPFQETASGQLEQRIV